MDSDSPISLTVTPIGVIRCTHRTKFDAPSQPDAEGSKESTIELYPDHDFEQALRDLEGFDRIWLVWWFHKNSTWRPLVLPPRSSTKRRGVFATRSPHRPNPIGLTAVPLISIQGRKLVIGEVDLLDGTPILDIKPYISTIDAFPEASRGWLTEVEQRTAEGPAYSVEFDDIANEQIKWLREEWQVDFLDRALQILSRFPAPHRTYRITKYGEDRLRIGCGGWRMLFRVVEKVVVVECVLPGYPSKLLHDESYTDIPDRAAQLAFLQQWPT